MPDDLHNYSDEALLAEVARRLGLRTSTSPAPPTTPGQR